MNWLLTLLFVGSVASAYIPPTRTILEKTVDNAGTSGYQIEKEVRFANPEIPVFKETWMIENDRVMRLTVSAANPVPGQPSPRFTALYTGGVKYVLWGTAKEAGKIPEEMTERLFHFHRVENLISYLNQLGILSTTQGNLDLSRLNRSQGVVTFGLGRPTEENSKNLAPYLWIDQDSFVVRKIRYSEDTELTANQYQVYPKGLNYPLITSLNWADQKVKLNTLSVSVVKKFPPTTFQSTQLEDSKPFQQSYGQWNALIEFYKRFR